MPLAEGSLAFTTAKPQGERILEDLSASSQSRCAAPSKAYLAVKD
jgi:hypothetical protein